MSRRVVFRRAAAADFAEARKWYESQLPGLGEDFTACVDAAVASASRSPLQHPTVHRKIRRVLVRRFPYGVFYVTQGQALVVLAVFHCARNPKVWRGR